MGRIRSLQPGWFSDDEWLNVRDFRTRVFGLGLWCAADDNGIFEWKPDKLRRVYLPDEGRDCSGGDMLEELKQAGIIAEFVVDGRTYGAVKNFHRFQSPKKPNFKYPVPLTRLGRGYAFLAHEGEGHERRAVIVESVSDRSGLRAAYLWYWRGSSEGKGKGKGKGSTDTDNDRPEDRAAPPPEPETDAGGRASVERTPTGLGDLTTAGHLAAMQAGPEGRLEDRLTRLCRPENCAAWWRGYVAVAAHAGIVGDVLDAVQRFEECQDPDTRAKKDHGGEFREIRRAVTKECFTLLRGAGLYYPHYPSGEWASVESRNRAKLDALAARAKVGAG